MNIEDRFKRNLKKQRELLGIYQEELGHRCGFSASNMSAFETGTRVPSLRTLGRIAKGLNCSYSDLLD